MLEEAIIKSKTGMLVGINDPISLANTIIELITNKTLLKQMGKKARLLAEKSFEVSSVVEKHYSLYQKLL